MVINIQKFRKKRQEREAYKQLLVEQIREHHRLKPDGERADEFYFEHISSHFSIEMLEDILQRMQLKVSNT
ncbi:MAG: hypothetical protein NTX25_19360 [Proteobacteria bacterium]|nr:hypothetical protein [Pseudomonadota bacterium]